MQVEALDAAMKLILAGPADQPLMRILGIASDVARCSAAMIGVRRDDAFYIIASCGIPLTNFREKLPRSDAIAKNWSQPSIVADASAEDGFANHPYVVGPPNWRFIASAPVPLGMLPYAVVLSVADPRTDVVRPDDLLTRLEECAAIAADELRLIGDIALQSQHLAATPSDMGILSGIIANTPLPVALVDADLIIRAASPHFTEQVEHATVVGQPITTVHGGARDDYVQHLRNVIETGEALSGYAIKSYDGRHTYRVDAFRCTTLDGLGHYLILIVNDRSAMIRRGDHALHHDGDSPGVVSRFLLSTLIAQRRLLRRGPVPYHALYRWRSTIKDVQIEALKALKRDPGDAFLGTVAEQMAGAAAALFGSGTFKAVVPVPCGSSGGNCLSVKLARLIAVRLGVDFIEAFEPIDLPGSSHPKNNIRRPAMRIKAAPKVPVLLIDDVATSGAHIEEAAQLLRRSAPAVLPLVWIAD